MKEYRLCAWPELRGRHARIGYRRLVSDLSQRHSTIAQLAETSGMRRQDVQDFIDWLAERQLVAVREHDGNRLREVVTELARWPGRTWRAAMRGD